MRILREASRRLPQPQPRRPVDQERRQEILRLFGETVRAHRARAGLSQEELAFAAGLDRTYVGGVERGERNLSLVNIVRIAEALNTAPSTLLETLNPRELDSS